MFGDVSAVFARKYISQSTVLSPVDTGFFQAYCINRQGIPMLRLSCNCSAMTAFKELGTFQHNLHLFLHNQDFWESGGLLHSTIQRLEPPWGSNPVSGSSFLKYFEGARLGKLAYPTAIRFLIGSFPVLFGTPLGVSLQTWALNRGWVLVWSLGPNDKRLLHPTTGFDFGPVLQNLDFKVNQRILDPVVLAKTTATSSLKLDSSVVQKFRKLWEHVVALRSQAQVGMPQKLDSLERSPDTKDLVPCVGSKRALFVEKVPGMYLSKYLP